MKLTETQLRQIIREELLKEQKKRKWTITYTMNSGEYHGDLYIYASNLRKVNKHSVEADGVLIEWKYEKIVNIK